MKKILSSTAVLVLAACMGLGSCTGNFEEYNTNGETPGYGNVDPSTLLEQLISTGAYYIYERSWRVNNELMQYTVDCSASGRHQRYIFQAADFGTPWDRFQRYAANADHMIALGRKYEDVNAMAIAMTLKAVFVSLLADLYGDIPYREAYRIEEGISQPAIDPQSEVYHALIELLLEANDLYITTKDSNGSYTDPLAVPGKDLLYGGDIAAWRKLTNSLCLRLCLRLSNRPEAETAGIMQQIVADPVKYPIFTSTADDAKVAYTNVVPFRNPFGDMTDASFTTSSHKCAAFFIDQLNSTSDPRMAQWVKIVSADDIHGVESGVVEPDGTGACVMNVSVLKQYTTPVWLMTSSEVWFILCEAAQKNMIPGGEAAAESYYEQAVACSIRQWNPSISDANIDRFLHCRGIEGRLRRHAGAGHPAKMGIALHAGLRIVVRLPPHGLPATADRPRHGQRRHPAHAPGLRTDADLHQRLQLPEASRPDESRLSPCRQGRETQRRGQHADTRLVEQARRGTGNGRNELKP